MKKLVSYFIPGNVPSSKNSLRPSRWGGLYYDKTTKKYIGETEPHWEAYAELFRETFNANHKPMRIAFKFVRKSKHKFDYINPCQIIQDLMVKHGWMPDDNCDEIIPVFEPYEYDKEKPGVLISIL